MKLVSKILGAMILGMLLFNNAIARTGKPFKANFVVAKDGSGNFTTVQAAIDAVPNFSKKKTVIYIKNGVYKENITVPTNKTNVELIGENAKKTILTYDNYAEKKNIFGKNIGTSGSSSFFEFGNGFTAKNITFQNSAGPVGQAVAIRVDGDKAVFVHCRFLGNQDTMYNHGHKSREYFKDCYIEGTVDFIFGWATAVFDHCTIYCKTSGCITAASTPKTSRYGYVFKDCKIVGSAASDTYYLGRPWRAYADVTYIDCYLGKQIKPAGWSNWHNTDRYKTAHYAEYGSYGPGANSSARVSWSHQLTAKQVKKYTMKNIFNGWNPNSKSGDNKK